MTATLENLPAPADFHPRWTPLNLSLPNSEKVVVKNDSYSDRIRCDHPAVSDGKALGRALLSAAQRTRRDRILVFAPDRLQEGLEAAGLATEAIMPGYYRGESNCAVLGMSLVESRGRLARPRAVAKVNRLIEERPAPKARQKVETLRAGEDDAEAIASLIAETFEHYPTPSGVPEYIAELIGLGIPFRIVRDEDEIVACASADLVRHARTAELTDCATRPEYRGRGLMQFILSDLMDDLRLAGYPTAFTLARAGIAGVNLAFQRLGFEWRGQLAQSCRIGGGIEDINVWSRAL